MTSIMSSNQSPSRNLLTPNSHNSIPDNLDQLNSSSYECPASPTTPTVNIDIDYLKNEQKKIDTTINFLLNYNPKKKKPGRPPKTDTTNTNAQFPDSVPDQFKSIIDINDLHPGVLLDYLTKVNNFNKKILCSLNSLNEKYDCLSRKIEQCVNSNVKDSSILPNTNISKPNVSGVSSEVRRQIESYENVNEEFQLRLDNLEQRHNSTALTISGIPLPSAAPEDNFESLNNYKFNIIDKIIDKTDRVCKSEEIDDVIVIGKEKRNIKVICRTLDVKKKFLNFARQQKPNNIFISEFLTPYRNKLFFQARQLKKNYPNIISAVYTRGGNIFYKFKDKPRYYKIRKFSDIDDLKSKLLNPPDNTISGF